MTGPDLSHAERPQDRPGARLDHALRQRKTPLLRISEDGRLLAKLESLRPAGCVDDRALGSWDEALAALEGVAGRAAPTFAAALPSSAVLAGAAWARARGLGLQAFVHGTLTHEVTETLRLWGAQLRPASSREEAGLLSREAARSGAILLPPLDGVLAAQAIQRSLGGELIAQLEEAGRACEQLVGPASAALAGVLCALQERFPALRAHALCAAGPAELPELPSLDESRALLAQLAPGARVELVPISRGEAGRARAELARSHGLSASHAAAASVARARALRAPASSGAVLALVSATGEREFSLDPAGREPARAPER